MFGHNGITAAATTEDVPAQGSVMVAVVLVAIVLGYGLWFYFSTSKRLARKLEKMRPDTLEQEYPAIYKLYLSLSENSRVAFYPQMLRLRQELEEQVQAEKNISLLLEQKHISIAKMKKNYDQIQEQWYKLLVKQQQKLYPQLVHMRQQLEHGREL